MKQIIKIALLSLSVILSVSGCSKRQTTKTQLKWDFIEESPKASSSIWKKNSESSLEELMKANENGGIILNGADLSNYDLSNNFEQLQISNWSSITTWPSSTSLPKTFNPKKIMAIGKNPGLNIRKLHKQGVTGENIGIGIIDGPLLTEHIEYKDQLHFYGEYNLKNNGYADDHASAVSSIAVGKNIGVAPKANLFFIVEGMFRENTSKSQINKALAQDINRFIKLNQNLKENQKIRIISISASVYMQEDNYDKVEEAILKANKNNITVLTSNKYSKDFAMGLSRLFYGDPDDMSSYIPASYMDSANVNRLPRFRESKLIVPFERRTLASSTGIQDYQYVSISGVSWSIPYVAGVYALACQQKPEITYEEFIQIANETAVPLKTTYKNQEYTFEKVISPENIIAYLQSNE